MQAEPTRTRILYVADSLMAGGIESQLVELATRLDRARFEPHILCLYGPTARALHYSPVVRAADIPLYLPDLTWAPLEKLRGILAIATTARAVRPQIIQAEGYHANLLARLASPAIPRTTRLVGSLRGVHSRKQMLYERLSQHTCSAFVVNAPHLGESLVRQGGVPARKVTHIPNGITIERFATPHDHALRQPLAPDARRVFVSMGRISFEKNMHWIAEALGLLAQRHELPDGLRALIVGPTQDAGAQALLDAAVASARLGAVVTQHPATPHPEDYYHAADATILCSPNEGLPNVAIESLAAGRPVMISANANAAGVIEDGVTGWVVRTGDTEHLAATILTVCTLPDERLAVMRNACLHRAQAYTVARMVERYTNFYERLAPSTTAAVPLVSAGLGRVR